ncbi:MAG: HAMP domain-containing sensor histidine kinase [Vallitaleaceae bacterium]|jgi:two-component system sensor histidine kinase VanS|nr:HAMP domain-containing sensor histidine kinase [Vallitaleaceae bacterium]
MIKKSISSKIFIVILGFTLSIFVLIGLAVKLFLPDYYVSQKVKAIDNYTSAISADYKILTYDELVAAFEAMRDEVGGDIYLSDQSGQVKGYGKNKKSSVTEVQVSGDLFDYQFTNKMGIEIYSFGVLVGDEYLVYEVSLASLDGAVDTIISFFILLLLISLVIAGFAAYLISIQVTKPIKKLNELAKQMKHKQIQHLQIYSNDDEIGELNHSMNLLYEELLSNIQQLEVELSKEKSLDNMKKQFLAQTTHELKTPLSVIQGYAELVYDKIYNTEEERDHYIKSIYQETENMNKLIIDTLDYAKMENGFFTIEPKDTFVNPWFNQIMSTFKELIASKNITLEINNQVGDLCITMDAFRIEQVIRNLIANAIEHADQNNTINALEHADKKITINAYNLRNHLVIEVINTGKNIAPEDIPYIFDSFYKREGKKNGTGLGLAIVKQIVKLHHGEYRVQNMADAVKFSIII